MKALGISNFTMTLNMKFQSTLSFLFFFAKVKFEKDKILLWFFSPLNWFVREKNVIQNEYEGRKASLVIVHYLHQQTLKAPL